MVLIALLWSTNWFLMSNENWLHAFKVEAIFWLTWSIFVPLIVSFTRRLSKQPFPLYSVAMLHLALGIAASMLQRSITVVFWWYIAPEYFSPAPSSLLEALSSRFYRFIPLGLMFYAGVVMGTYILDFYKKYREKELKAAQLESLLASAELQSLKMQLHPHFLFNVLNSIAGLMHEDLRAADEMLARLGSFLRLTLDSSRAQLVPLHEELEFLRHYLAIEEIRFQDRLAVQWDIDPKTLDTQVPSLILQPIVENAIKHGVGDRSERGCVLIRSASQDGAVVLQVSDNGPGLNADRLSQKAGIGITNTRLRLEEMYGGTSSMTFDRADGGGLCVTIHLPIPKVAATMIASAAKT